MAIDRLAILDQRIATLRKRLEAAERLREAVGDDPELLELLQGEEGKVASGTNGRPRGPGRPKKRVGIHGGPKAMGDFEKIAAWLEAAGNKPHTVQAIAEGTGMDRNEVVQVVYKTHKVLFEGTPLPERPNFKQWRLVKGWKEAFANARKAEA